jgi:bifunctional DNase/RNase
MTVSALEADPLTRLPIVVLRDEQGDTTMRVSVGQREAAAIAAELDGIELERPTTHQLTCRLLEVAGARISRVEIVDYSGDVWHARVAVRLSDGAEVAQPARCSDALALALHVGADVLVARQVVDACATRALLESPGVDSDLECLADDVFGKWKM